MSVISVTVSCSATGRRVYLRSAGFDGSTPPSVDNAVACSDSGENGGQLVITPVVDMPVLVTVEVGRVARRPHAELLYDGPMILVSGQLVVMDGEGQSVDPVPFLLKPGTHRVVAQASGRDKAASAFKAFVNLPEGDMTAWRPVEHWWITFPEQRNEARPGPDRVGAFRGLG